jgi:predicted nucleic acid-binding protein
VTALLDTSVVVRYLTLDHPTLSPLAQALIDGSVRVALTSVALVETAFVLPHHYGVPRSTVVDLHVGLSPQVQRGDGWSVSFGDYSGAAHVPRFRPHLVC